MIHVIDDLPGNVLGLEASGKVSGSDYDQVIIPAIDAKQRQYGQVSLLYILGAEFEGYTAGAFWADSSLMFRHPRSWERIAIVTDTDWMRTSVSLFGWIIPAEAKVFACKDATEAREWVVATEQRAAAA